jgi:hypothetical protein
MGEVDSGRDAAGVAIGTLNNFSDAVKRSK